MCNSRNMEHGNAYHRVRWLLRWYLVPVIDLSPTFPTTLSDETDEQCDGLSPYKTIIPAQCYWEWGWVLLWKCFQITWWYYAQWIGLEGERTDFVMRKRRTPDQSTAGVDESLAPSLLHESDVREESSHWRFAWYWGFFARRFGAGVDHSYAPKRWTWWWGSMPWSSYLIEWENLEQRNKRLRGWRPSASRTCSQIRQHDAWRIVLWGCTGWWWRQCLDRDESAIVINYHQCSSSWSVTSDDS